MTKTHDFTPEFLQTPGLHLVRLGVLQRYVAQEDDQPVGVRAGDEFIALRHRRDEAALPLTDGQAQLLRGLDPARPFDPNLLTQDEVAFVLTLLRLGALVPVLDQPELALGETVLSQLDFVPVLRQSLEVVDRIQDVYVLRVVETEDEDGGRTFVDGPEIPLSRVGVELVMLHSKLTRLLADAPAAAQEAGVSLGEAAEVFGDQLVAGDALLRLSDDELHDALLFASLEVVSALGDYGSFSFEAREEVVA